MRYAEIKENDVVNGVDVCVSFWAQGCNLHCKNCHNKELWDFNNGTEFTSKTLDYIINCINKNGILRNFSILGGEPLCPQNLFMTEIIIQQVRKVYPNIKIYLWTGYTFEALIKRIKEDNNNGLKYILSDIDALIDGPYIDSQRDITLYLRGSKNQKIRYKDEIINAL